jgi:hypothetical protein
MKQILFYVDIKVTLFRTLPKKKMKILYLSMGVIKRIDLDKNSLIIHHGLFEP